MRRSPISVLHGCDPDENPFPAEQFAVTAQDMLVEHGYVHLTGLPDAFDPVSFGRELGPLMPHYNGTLVAEVRATGDTTYYPGSTRAFSPHTEGYDLVCLPPRYLALWCVRPTEGPGGQTTLADTTPWLERLDGPQRRHLEQFEYDWSNPHGEGLDTTVKHPVIETHDANTIVRFSCNNIVRNEDDVVAALQRLWQEWYADDHIEITYARNDMLIWDNWRMLHARNAHQDPNRHLRRIHIATDAGRSDTTAPKG
ncbi:TauD/TfdA family dioxygenase [Amycolatopsis sp. NPDC051071]|uniref:TauD/TfdA family dioxygenase n=1 Tax=Amycolatopsis sp. NPDC051071 TaxID=3154637 RepID=UPI00342A510D